MRKLVMLLLLLAVTATASAQAARSVTPRILLVERAPLVVRGAGFRPGERVRVLLLAGSRVTAVTRVSQAGTFVVRFERSVGRCTRFSLLASGSGGSRARLLPTRKSIDCVSSG
jgi:hypothetical protein